MWVSELLFKSDSNYPESEPYMLFISIPLFLYRLNFSVRFSKDVLRNDLIPHPESQASYKKKEKKNPHPHERCVTAAQFAKFFQR